MKKVLDFIVNTFKNIDFKSKRTWVLFGLLVMIGFLSSLYVSYGYYLNSGTKNVVISGNVSLGSADITLQIYLQDRDSSGNAISNSYSRAYYIPQTNYSYESAKTVCGSGITISYDSTNHEFTAESTQRGICKVYFAADGIVMPNATFKLYVEKSLDSGNYTQIGSIPNNDYEYEINTTRTTCTDPNANVSLVGKRILVESSMDLDCTIYVDAVLATTVSTYLEENTPAGYRGSSHTDSATQNLYRFVGGYQSSDSAYSSNVDNYVCLGINGSTCPTDNMYRIIGVVAENDSTTGLEAGMVKVIKNTSIGIYTWDGGTGVADSNKNVNSSNYRSTWTCTSSNYSYGSNCFPSWEQSYLNTNILNQNYLNSLLFEDKIASVKWHCYVGSSAPTAASEYSANLCSNTPTKISIINAGDYLNSYNNGSTSSSTSYKPWVQTCTSDTNTGDSIDGKYNCAQWTTASSGFIYWGADSFYWDSWRAYTDGSFDHKGYFDAYNYVAYSSSYGVRPVFYLDKNVKLVSGSGTYANPFRIV
jgi:hypothetical protein